MTIVAIEGKQESLCNYSTNTLAVLRAGEHLASKGRDWATR